MGINGVNIGKKLNINNTSIHLSSLKTNRSEIWTPLSTSFISLGKFNAEYPAFLPVRCSSIRSDIGPRKGTNIIKTIYLYINRPIATTLAPLMNLAIPIMYSLPHSKGYSFIMVDENISTIEMERKIKAPPKSILKTPVSITNFQSFNLLINPKALK